MHNFQCPRQPKAGGTINHIIDKYLFHPKDRFNLSAYNSLIVSELCEAAYELCQAAHPLGLRIAGFVRMDTISDTYDPRSPTSKDNATYAFVKNNKEAVYICTDKGEHVGMLTMFKRSVGTVARRIATTTSEDPAEYKLWVYAHNVYGYAPSHKMTRDEINNRILNTSVSCSTNQEYIEFVRSHFETLCRKSIEDLHANEYGKAIYETNSHKEICKKVTTGKVRDRLEYKIVEYREYASNILRTVDKNKFEIMKETRSKTNLPNATLGFLGAGHSLAILDCVFNNTPLANVMDTTMMFNMQQMHINLHKRVTELQDNLKVLEEYIQQPKYVVMVNSLGYSVTRIAGVPPAPFQYNNEYDCLDRISHRIQSLIKGIEAQGRGICLSGTFTNFYYDLDDMPQRDHDELVGMLAPFKIYVTTNTGDNNSNHEKSYYFTDEKQLIPAWDALWNKDLLAYAYGPSYDADPRTARGFAINIT